MINRDDPRHLQQRKLLSGRFSPRAVRRHSERVRAIAAELIAPVAAKGAAEVVSELAAPLQFAPGYFTRTLRELWVEFTPAA